MIASGDDNHHMALHTPHFRLHLARALVGALVVLAVVPAVASAACDARVRADVRATAQVVEELQAAGSPNAATAADIATRARRSCADARSVRAIVTATSRLGAPTIGRRARVQGIDLIGLQVAGVGAWRIDLARTAQRAAGARTTRQASAPLGVLRAAGFGSLATAWSADPTRLAWDPGQQSAVVALVARARVGYVRRLAIPGVRAFAAGARPAALGRLPLLEHLLVANRVASAAASSANGAAIEASRVVAVRAMVRIRAARVRSWSRIDGAYSTLPAHRALVAQGALLLRRHVHPTTAAVVTELRDALRSPAAVDFGALPVAAFYPWPRDGAFDTQAVSFDLDKPANVSLLIYGDGDRLLRSVEAAVDPGTTTLTWDGASTDGTIQPAGDYRYNLDVRDRAGIRVRVPGLEQFRVARDATAPTIQEATVRLVGAGAGRRVVASWKVTEVHSPAVVTWVLLQSGEERQSIRLHDSLQAATVRRPVTLQGGTWRATMVFIDGSGNRAQQAAGSFVVR